MKNIFKALSMASLVIVPTFSYAEDGAEAIKNFQERNKAIAQQQATEKAKHTETAQKWSKDAKKPGNVYNQRLTPASSDKSI